MIRRRITKANYAGFLRLALAGPVAFALALEAHGLAFALLAVSALSDVADGYFARRERTVSSFGVYLDLTADKVLVTAVLCVLLTRGELSTWVVLAILLRESIVMGVRGFASSENVSIPPSTLGGAKIITTYLAMASSTLAFTQARLVWFAVVVLTIASGLHYLYSARSLFVKHLYYSPAARSGSVGFTATE